MELSNLRYSLYKSAATHLCSFCQISGFNPLTNTAKLYFTYFSVAYRSSACYILRYKVVNSKALIICYYF